MPLAKAEPHVFEIKAKGFHPYGGFGSPRVAEGTTDLRLVLRRAPSITLRVLDAETDERILRFGARIQVIALRARTTPEERHPSRVEDHPDGECVLTRPEGKLIALVQAPGYSPAAIELPEEHSPGAVHVIRLERGSSLSGRVLHDGAPASKARLVLERAMREHPSSTPNSNGFPRPEDYDLSPFVGRERELTTKEDGSFRFEDLAAGTYDLTCRRPDRTSLARRGIRVSRVEHVALGDLRLESGASLGGRLVVAPRQSFQGWRLTVDGPGSHDERDLEADGRFSFEGLFPGRHVVRVIPVGVSLVHTVHTVDLAAGENRDVEVDVSDFYPGIVSARVTRAGQGLEGVGVMVRCSEEGMPHGGLGSNTDVNGRVDVHVRPCGALRV